MAELNPDAFPDEELSDAVRATEQEIHEEAFQEPKDTAEGEPDQQQDAQGDERPRDEQGRFAAKEAGTPADQAEKPQTGQQEQAGEKQDGKDGKDDGESVPRWRLREITEERRQAQAERDALRAELIKLQTMQARQAPPEQEKQQEIDPLLDPNGFAKQIRQEFEQRLSTERLNNNLAMAHMRHGEVFEKAYEAVVHQGQNGNRQLVSHLTSAANPGDAIVGWYRQQEMMRETNGDLGAFKEKMRGELLKDPEFLKAAIETVRNGNGQQQGQQGQRPNNVTRLPPSLSRTAGSSANADPTDTDDSDRAIFDYAFK